MRCPGPLPLVLAGLALVPALAGGQDQVAQPVRINERFSGEVAARAPGPEAARLDETEPIAVQILNVSLTGGQEVDRLPVREDATLILQLRAGELVTVIDGVRVEREEGEFWTVTPDQEMVLVTEDDTAVISVTAVQSE